MILARAPHEYPGPGEWSPIEADGQGAVVVCCPECFHRDRIEADAIDLHGNMEIGLRCNGDCGWFVPTVQLQGWRLN